MSRRSTTKPSRSSSRRTTRPASRSTRSAILPTVASLPSTASGASTSAVNVMPSISGLLNRIESAVNPDPASTWRRPASAPETSCHPPSMSSVRDLLEHNTDNVILARNRLEAGRRGSFYFLTMPGIVRILEVVVAVTNIGIFGYYCTHYEKVVKIILPPFFLCHAREQFFMLSNYHSLMGCMVIILAGVFSSMSNTALISSLYPLIFDFVQTLTIAASSVAMLQFYKRNEALIAKVMPVGSQYKEAMSYAGLILACLHFASIAYDWKVFMKRIKILRMEKEALQREDEAAVK